MKKANKTTSLLNIDENKEQKEIVHKAVIRASLLLGFNQKDLGTIIAAWTQT